MKFRSPIEHLDPKSNHRHPYGERPQTHPGGPPAESKAQVATFDRHWQTIRKIALYFLAAACFCVAALMTTAAFGQEYDSIPVRESLTSQTAIGRMKGETRSMATSGRGDGRIVRAYYAQYLPAAMTAPDGPEKMSEIVDDVTGYLLRANRGQRREVAAGLTNFTFNCMSRVATGNHHPTARIAATVILGDLVSSPADIGSRKPQVPLLKSLPILISLYQDQNNVDGLRAAALQGIHKHAMFAPANIPGQVREQIMAMMNQLLDEQPPKQRDPQAHAFLQRYAVDVLDILSPADDASLGMKLVSLSTQPKYPEMIALHSASRLARRTKVIEKQVDNPQRVLASWTTRLLTAFESEIERIESMERKQVTVRQPQDPSTHLRRTESSQDASSNTSGIGAAGGGLDDFRSRRRSSGRSSFADFDDTLIDDTGGSGRRQPAVVQDAEVVAGRRKLNHVMQQIHLAVTGRPTTGMPTQQAGGLLEIADQKTASEISKWAEEMALVSQYINDLTIEKTPEFVIVLRDQIQPLEKLIKDMGGDAEMMMMMKNEGGEKMMADKMGKEMKMEMKTKMEMEMKKDGEAMTEMSEEEKLEAALLAKP